MKKLNINQRFIILISAITVIVIIGIVVGANVIKTNITNGKYNSSNSGSNNGNLLPEYIKKGITLGGVTGTLEVWIHLMLQLRQQILHGEKPHM